MVVSTFLNPQHFKSFSELCVSIFQDTLLFFNSNNMAKFNLTQIIFYFKNPPSVLSTVFVIKLKYYLIKSSNKIYVISFHNYCKLSHQGNILLRKKKSCLRFQLFKYKPQYGEIY